MAASSSTIPFANPLYPAGTVSARRASWYGRKCDGLAESPCRTSGCVWVPPSAKKSGYCTASGAKDIELQNILALLREEKEGKFAPTEFKTRAAGRGVPETIVRRAWKGEERKAGGKTAGRLQYAHGGGASISLADPEQRRRLLERLEQRARYGIEPTGYAASAAASAAPSYDRYYDNYYDYYDY